MRSFTAIPTIVLTATSIMALPAAIISSASAGAPPALPSLNATLPLTNTTAPTNLILPTSSNSTVSNLTMPCPPPPMAPMGNITMSLNGTLPGDATLPGSLNGTMLGNTTLFPINGTSINGTSGLCWIAVPANRTNGTLVGGPEGMINGTNATASLLPLPSPPTGNSSLPPVSPSRM